MKIINGTVFCADGQFHKKDLWIQDGVFQEPFSEKADHSRNECGESEDVIDAKELLVLPGLVDIHFHGCKGHDFCDGTQEALQAIADYEASVGVTSIVPASMTLKKENLLSIFHEAAIYPSDHGSRFLGINMEGPFVAKSKKGAQNASYIHRPDIDFFLECQEAANGLIRHVLIAPEIPGAIDFIQKCQKESILPDSFAPVVSLGHTACDYETAMAAFLAGADHVTHLFNAMNPFSHRAPGLIGAARDASAYVELICDGIHIHESVIRATFSMFDPDKIVLISDSMMATGMEDGMYTLGGQDVKVTGNRAVLLDGTIAGSATNLFDCMKNAIRFGIPKEQAILSATLNPAKSIGLDDKVGSITPGKYGDVILTDRDFNLKSVIIGGHCFTN